MGRIRTIKPEFPQSETIGKLSRDARLLFIQLWTIADDAGRLRGAPRMLASLLFPYDEDAPARIDGWLAELETVGCIRRYVSDDSSYVDIPHWTKHQKIDRPSESRLPRFVLTERNSPVEPEVARDFDDQSRRVDADLGPGTKDQEDSSLRSLSIRAIEKFAEDFYEAYPKRVDPKAAKDKFRSAVRLGVDPLHIIEAAKRFGEAHRLAGTDKRFIPAPGVWLDKGGYDNEDLPVPLHNEIRRSHKTNTYLNALAELQREAFEERDGTVDEAHSRLENTKD
jgi:hypothetical protein